ncbi:unnamed protein product [Sphenostylis stenocarpa]|uniref:Uncharacterized protein n=1 Tax=Sphenostylis stenocarpa TaxID=92480 RepID=A0AA86SQZ3_9FABA|nr:unnamed protein product [Sphenostylis stenocarpa]
MEGRVESCSHALRMGVVEFEYPIILHGPRAHATQSRNSQLPSPASTSMLMHSGVKRLREEACSMVEEEVWEQWMFQPNACIEVENDKGNNQFDRCGKMV